jgi:hypothetical protein
MSDRMRGRRLSASTRAKIAAALKGRRGQRGRRLSEETKQKISEALLKHYRTKLGSRRREEPIRRGTARPGVAARGSGASRKSKLVGVNPRGRSKAPLRNRLIDIRLPKKRGTRLVIKRRPRDTRVRFRRRFKTHRVWSSAAARRRRR